MFNQRLQQKIDLRAKHGDRFQYTEGFSAEVQTFVKTNYDTGEFDIDFKQLAKQKKERLKQEMAIAHARTLNKGVTTHSTHSSEERKGLYRTGIIENTAAKGQNRLESLNDYELFDPKKLQVAPGLFDFTKAHGYDEELTRYNLNYVKRPDTAQILAPTLIKEVKKKEKPDFVRTNKTGLGEVSSINLKRV